MKDLKMRKESLEKEWNLLNGEGTQLRDRLREIDIRMVEIRGALKEIIEMEKEEQSKEPNNKEKK